MEHQRRNRLGLTFLLLCLSLSRARAEPGSANLPAAWDADSNHAIASVGEEARNLEVSKMILQLVAAWNAHSLNGYLSYFWASPKLVVVEDGEVASGWDQLRAKYLNGLPDPSLMGQFEAQRTQVQVLEPDLAYVLLWWDMLIGRQLQKVIGTSTLVVRHFPEGWKIVAAHTQSLAL